MKGTGGAPPVRIAIFRAEESTRFTKDCLGSRAAFLGLIAGELGLSYDRNDVPISLAQSVTAVGGLPECLHRPTLDPRVYRAYFETHIEQARC
jgi:hypothetical protein